LEENMLWNTNVHDFGETVVGEWIIDDKKLETVIFQRFCDFDVTFKFTYLTYCCFRQICIDILWHLTDSRCTLLKNNDYGFHYLLSIVYKYVYGQYFDTCFKWLQYPMYDQQFCTWTGPSQIWFNPWANSLYN
jgi:hypothetical protein